VSTPDTTTTIHEIAPELFRLTSYLPAFDMQFHQFLARDEEPLLYHTGMRSLFPLVRDAVAKLIEPSTLRWIGFSHFEADECGALNEWLALAPRAEAVCSFVGKSVSVDDFASRPSRALGDGEVLSTGRFRFRHLATPQVPHAWDAGLLFEETQSALLCSDLYHQLGNLEVMTSNDLVDRFPRLAARLPRNALRSLLAAHALDARDVGAFGQARAKLLLPMHGSVFQGNGGTSLRRVAAMLDETIGPAAAG
jgi:flavorubredoxin